MDEANSVIESPTDARTPAGEAAFAEYAKVVNDPTHPHHHGLKRGDKAANDYVDALYRKAYGNKQVALDANPGLSSETPRPEPHGHETHAPEDTVAETEVDTMLRRTFGDEYDTTMRDMRIGAGRLFGSDEGRALLDTLSPLIVDLGPEAEVAGIRFLSHLGQIAQRRTS